MNPMNKLRAELAAARERVAGKTFAKAAEAFKDVEGLKVRIRHCRDAYRSAKQGGQNISNV
jgi:hypothetical protein